MLDPPMVISKERRQKVPLTNNEVNSKRHVYFHEEDASVMKLMLSQLKHYDPEMLK